MSHTVEELMPFDQGEVLPPEDRLLGPDERVQIDTELVLADREEMWRGRGINGSLVADINAAGKWFSIVDTRGTGKNRDFYVIDEDFSLEQQGRFKGVTKGLPVFIGRKHHKDRFVYPPTVSRNQFQVSYEDNGLFVTNLRPMNATRIKAYLRDPQNGIPITPRHRVVGNRTVGVVARMQANPNFGEKDETAPYGYYMNHPILGKRSTSVDDGVYLGGSAREAIIVDGKSDIVKQVYDEINADMQRALKGHNTILTQAVLLNVMHKV